MLQWLEESMLAAYLKSSNLLYPLVETAHILGFVVMIGSAFMFDLKLLGFSKKLSVQNLANHLLPWSRRAFIVVVFTGFLLFITNAEALFINNVFRIKIILVIIALLNAAIFHLFTYPSIKNDFNPTFYSKMTAVLSIVLWTGVMTCGRLLAYL